MPMFRMTIQDTFEAEVQATDEEQVKKLFANRQNHNMTSKSYELLKIDLLCKHCDEPLSNHVVHDFCAGQPLNHKDEFSKGYKPKRFEP